MKANAVTGTPKFTPVALTVVFESSGELENFIQFIGNTDAVNVANVMRLPADSPRLPIVMKMMLGIYDAITGVR